MRRLLNFPLLALLLLALPSVVHAAWPTSVLTGLPISLAPGYQSLSSLTQNAMCPDGAGGFFVVWQDGRTATGNGQDIYGQRINSQGVAVWTTDGLDLTPLAGDQYQATILADGAGGFFMTFLTNTAPSRVIVQRYSAAGTALWGAGGIAVSSTTPNQSSPMLVSDGGTGIIAAWQDQRTAGNGNDLYAQRFNVSGVAQWTADGVPVATSTGNQTIQWLAADPAGGAWAVWTDDANTATRLNDLYANRITAAGTLGLSSTLGIAVSTTTANAYNARLQPDGVGGAYIAWEENRITNYQTYLSRFLPNGSSAWAQPVQTVSSITTDALRLVPDGASGVFVIYGSASNGLRAVRFDVAGTRPWGSSELQIATGSLETFECAAIADGKGGAIVSWDDDVSFSTTIARLRAQRFDGSGALLWGATGMIASAPNATMQFPYLLTDGSGGAFLTWVDYREGPNDIFGAHIDRTGRLGGAEPSISAIRDIPNDQGGVMRLTFTGSSLDQTALNRISTYTIYRQVPAALAQAAIARGTHVLADDEDPASAASRGPVYRIQRLGAQFYYWEYATSVGPHGFDGYSTVIPTTGDSTGLGNPKTVYMVEAMDIQNYYYDSAPDSGYSVDNLPPAAPAPLPSQYVSGLAKLHWSRNHEPDLAGYRVYRSTSPVFKPNASNFVAAVADTGFADATSQPYYYELTAVDSHGNESPVAALTPQGVLGVGDGGGAATLALARPAPSPAISHTRIACTLPRAMRLELTLHDAAGRLVRRIAGEDAAAGIHAYDVNLHDGNGRALAPGIYLVRLAAGAEVRTQRLVVLGD